MVVLNAIDVASVGITLWTNNSEVVSLSPYPTVVPLQPLELFQPDYYLSSNPPMSWAGCSKVTSSLVNVLLKSQTFISEICQYFLLKKASLIFSTKKYQCIWL